MVLRKFPYRVPVVDPKISDLVEWLTQQERPLDHLINLVPAHVDLIDYSWPLPRSDLLLWVPVLKLVDAFIERILQGLAVGSVLEVTFPAERRTLVSVLRFLAILLRNTFNRSIYTCVDYVNGLLVVDDLEVLEAALTLGSVVLRRATRAARGRIEASRLLTLARGWGPTHRGMPLPLQCDLVASGGPAPASMSQVNFEYSAIDDPVGLPVTIRLAGLPDTGNGPSSSMAPAMRDLEVHYRQQFQRALRKYNVPLAEKFPLFHHMRLNTLVCAPEARETLVRIRLLAIMLIQFMAVDEASFRMLVFHEPEFMSDLASLISGDRVVPWSLQTLVLRIFEIVATANDSRTHGLVSALRLTADYGILVAILRKTLASIRSAEAPADIPPSFLTSLFSLIAVLVMSLPRSQRFAATSIFISMQPFLDGVFPRYTRATSLCLHVVDTMLFTQTSSVAPSAESEIHAFFNEHRGVLLVAQRLATELESMHGSLLALRAPAAGADAMDVDSGPGDGTETSASLAAGPMPFLAEMAIPMDQMRLIRVLFRFFIHAFRSNRAAETLRSLTDSPLMDAFRLVFANSHLFPSIYSTALSLLGLMIHTEPTSLVVFQELGITDLVLETLAPAGLEPGSVRWSPFSFPAGYAPLDRLCGVAAGTDAGLPAAGGFFARPIRPYPDEEALLSLPLLLSALCLNDAGVQAVRESRALEHLACVLTSPNFVNILSLSPMIYIPERASCYLPTDFGATFNELARHHPSLKPAAMAAVRLVLRNLHELADTVASNPGRFDAFTNLAMESESLVLESAGPNRAPFSFLLRAISSTCKFLEAFTRTPCVCGDLLREVPVPELLSLALLPGLPYTFSEGRSYSCITKLLGHLISSSNLCVKSLLPFLVERLGTSLATLQAEGSLFHKFSFDSHLAQFIGITDPAVRDRGSAILHALSQSLILVRLVADLTHLTLTGHIFGSMLFIMEYIGTPEVAATLAQAARLSLSLSKEAFLLYRAPESPAVLRLIETRRAEAAAENIQLLNTTQPQSMYQLSQLSRYFTPQAQAQMATAGENVRLLCPSNRMALYSVSSKFVSALTALLRGFAEAAHRLQAETPTLERKACFPAPAVRQAARQTMALVLDPIREPGFLLPGPACEATAGGSSPAEADGSSAPVEHTLVASSVAYMLVHRLHRVLAQGQPGWVPNIPMAFAFAEHLSPEEAAGPADKVFADAEPAPLLLARCLWARRQALSRHPAAVAAAAGGHMSCASTCPEAPANVLPDPLLRAMRATEIALSFFLNLTAGLMTFRQLFSRQALTYYFIMYAYFGEPEPLTAEQVAALPAPPPDAGAAGADILPGQPATHHRVTYHQLVAPAKQHAHVSRALHALIRFNSQVSDFVVGMWRQGLGTLKHCDAYLLSHVIYHLHFTLDFAQNRLPDLSAVKLPTPGGPARVSIDPLAGRLDRTPGAGFGLTTFVMPDWQTLVGGRPGEGAAADAGRGGTLAAAAAAAGPGATVPGSRPGDGAAPGPAAGPGRPILPGPGAGTGTSGATPAAPTTNPLASPHFLELLDILHGVSSPDSEDEGDAGDSDTESEDGRGSPSSGDEESIDILEPLSAAEAAAAFEVPEVEPDPSSVDMLQELGFSRADCERALRAAHNNLAVAADALLSQPAASRSAPPRRPALVIPEPVAAAGGASPAAAAVEAAAAVATAAAAAAAGAGAGAGAGASSTTEATAAAAAAATSPDGRAGAGGAEAETTGTGGAAAAGRPAGPGDAPLPPFLEVEMSAFISTLMDHFCELAGRRIAASRALSTPELIDQSIELIQSTERITRSCQILIVSLLLSVSALAFKQEDPVAGAKAEDAATAAASLTAHYSRSLLAQSKDRIREMIDRIVLRARDMMAELLLLPVKEEPGSAEAGPAFGLSGCPLAGSQGHRAVLRLLAVCFQDADFGSAFVASVSRQLVPTLAACVDRVLARPPASPDRPPFWLSTCLLVLVRVQKFSCAMDDGQVNPVLRRPLDMQAVLQSVEYSLPRLLDESLAEPAAVVAEPAADVPMADGPASGTRPSPPPADVAPADVPMADGPAAEAGPLPAAVAFQIAPLTEEQQHAVVRLAVLVLARSGELPLLENEQTLADDHVRLITLAQAGRSFTLTVDNSLCPSYVGALMTIEAAFMALVTLSSSRSAVRLFVALGGPGHTIRSCRRSLFFNHFTYANLLVRQALELALVDYVVEDLALQTTHARDPPIPLTRFLGYFQYDATATAKAMALAGLYGEAVLSQSLAAGVSAYSLELPRAFLRFSDLDLSAATGPAATGADRPAGGEAAKPAATSPEAVSRAYFAGLAREFDRFFPDTSDAPLTAVLGPLVDELLASQASRIHLERAFLRTSKLGASGPNYAEMPAPCTQRRRLAADVRYRDAHFYTCFLMELLKEVVASYPPAKYYLALRYVPGAGSGGGFVAPAAGTTAHGATGPGAGAASMPGPGGGAPSAAATVAAPARPFDSAFLDFLLDRILLAHMRVETPPGPKSSATVLVDSRRTAEASLAADLLLELSLVSTSSLNRVLITSLLGFSRQAAPTGAGAGAGAGAGVAAAAAAAAAASGPGAPVAAGAAPSPASGSLLTDIPSDRSPIYSARFEVDLARQLVLMIHHRVATLLDLLAAHLHPAASGSTGSPISSASGSPQLLGLPGQSPVLPAADSGACAPGLLGGASLPGSSMAAVVTAVTAAAASANTLTPNQIFGRLSILLQLLYRILSGSLGSICEVSRALSLKSLQFASPAKAALDAGFIPLLFGTLRVLNANFQAAPELITSILTPLAFLTKTANRLSQMMYRLQLSESWLASQQAPGGGSSAGAAGAKALAGARARRPGGDASDSDAEGPDRPSKRRRGGSGSSAGADSTALAAMRPGRARPGAAGASSSSSSSGASASRTGLLFSRSRSWFAAPMRTSLIISHSGPGSGLGGPSLGEIEFVIEADDSDDEEEEDAHDDGSEGMDAGSPVPLVTEADAQRLLHIVFDTASDSASGLESGSDGSESGSSSGAGSEAEDAGDGPSGSTGALRYAQIRSLSDYDRLVLLDAVQEQEQMQHAQQQQQQRQQRQQQQQAQARAHAQSLAHAAPAGAASGPASDSDAEDILLALLAADRSSTGGQTILDTGSSRIYLSDLLSSGGGGGGGPASAGGGRSPDAGDVLFEASGPPGDSTTSDSEPGRTSEDDEDLSLSEGDINIVLNILDGEDDEHDEHGSDDDEADDHDDVDLHLHLGLGLERNGRVVAGPGDEDDDSDVYSGLLMPLGRGRGRGRASAAGASHSDSSASSSSDEEEDDDDDDDDDAIDESTEPGVPGDVFGQNSDVDDEHDSLVEDDHLRDMMLYGEDEVELQLRRAGQPDDNSIDTLPSSRRRQRLILRRAAVMDSPLRAGPGDAAQPAGVSGSLSHAAGGVGGATRPGAPSPGPGSGPGAALSGPVPMGAATPGPVAVPAAAGSVPSPGQVAAAPSPEAALAASVPGTPVPAAAAAPGPGSTAAPAAEDPLGDSLILAVDDAFDVMDAAADEEEEEDPDGWDADGDPEDGGIISMPPPQGHHDMSDIESMDEDDVNEDDFGGETLCDNSYTTTVAPGDEHIIGEDLVRDPFDTMDEDDDDEALFDQIPRLARRYVGDEDEDEDEDEDLEEEEDDDDEEEEEDEHDIHTLHGEDHADFEARGPPPADALFALPSRNSPMDPHDGIPGDYPPGELNRLLRAPGLVVSGFPIRRSGRRSSLSVGGTDRGAAGAPGAERASSPPPASAPGPGDLSEDTAQQVAGLVRLLQSASSRLAPGSGGHGDSSDDGSSSSSGGSDSDSDSGAPSGGGTSDSDNSGASSDGSDHSGDDADVSDIFRLLAEQASESDDLDEGGDLSSPGGPGSEYNDILASLERILGTEGGESRAGRRRPIAGGPPLAAGGFGGPVSSSDREDATEPQATNHHLRLPAGVGYMRLPSGASGPGGAGVGPAEDYPSSDAYSDEDLDMVGGLGPDDLSETTANYTPADLDPDVIEFGMDGEIVRMGTFTSGDGAGAGGGGGGGGGGGPGAGGADAAAPGGGSSRRPSVRWVLPPIRHQAAAAGSPLRPGLLRSPIGRRFGGPGGGGGPGRRGGPGGHHPLGPERLIFSSMNFRDLWARVRLLPDPPTEDSARAFRLNSADAAEADARLPGVTPLGVAPGQPPLLVSPGGGAAGSAGMHHQHPLHLVPEREDLIDPAGSDMQSLMTMSEAVSPRPGRLAMPRSAASLRMGWSPSGRRPSGFLLPGVRPPGMAPPLSPGTQGAAGGGGGGGGGGGSTASPRGAAPMPDDLNALVLTVMPGAVPVRSVSSSPREAAEAPAGGLATAGAGGSAADAAASAASASDSTGNLSALLAQYLPQPGGLDVLAQQMAGDRAPPGPVDLSSINAFPNTHIVTSQLLALSQFGGGATGHHAAGLCSAPPPTGWHEPPPPLQQTWETANAIASLHARNERNRPGADMFHFFRVTQSGRPTRRDRNSFLPAPSAALDSPNRFGPPPEHSYIAPPSVSQPQLHTLPELFVPYVDALALIDLDLPFAALRDLYTMRMFPAPAVMMNGRALRRTPAIYYNLETTAYRWGSMLVVAGCHAINGTLLGLLNRFLARHLRPLALGLGPEAAGPELAQVGGMADDPAAESGPKAPGPPVPGFPANHLAHGRSSLAVSPSEDHPTGGNPIGRLRVAPSGTLLARSPAIRERRPTARLAARPRASPRLPTNVSLSIYLRSKEFSPSPLIDREMLFSLMKLLFVAHPINSVALLQPITFLCANRSVSAFVLAFILCVISPNPALRIVLGPKYSSLGFLGSRHERESAALIQRMLRAGPTGAGVEDPGDAPSWTLPSRVTLRSVTLLRGLIERSDVSGTINRMMLSPVDLGVILSATSQQAATGGPGAGGPAGSGSAPAAAPPGPGPAPVAASRQVVIPLIHLIELLHIDAIVHDSPVLENLMDLIFNVSLLLVQRQTPPMHVIEQLMSLEPAPIIEPVPILAPSPPASMASMAPSAGGPATPGPGPDTATSAPLPRSLNISQLLIPTTSVYHLVNLLQVPNCSSRTFGLTLLVLSNISELPRYRPVVRDAILASIRTLGRRTAADIASLADLLDRFVTVATVTQTDEQSSSTSSTEQQKIDVTAAMANMDLSRLSSQVSSQVQLLRTVKALGSPFSVDGPDSPFGQASSAGLSADAGPPGPGSGSGPAAAGAGAGPAMADGSPDSQPPLRPAAPVPVSPLAGAADATASLMAAFRWNIEQVFHDLTAAGLWRSLSRALDLLLLSSDLTHVSAVLLPVIECLFLICQVSIFKERSLPQTVDSTPCPSAGPSRAPSPGPGGGHPGPLAPADMAHPLPGSHSGSGSGSGSGSPASSPGEYLVKFVYRFKVLINHIIRSQTNLISKGTFLCLVTHLPDALDFDIKRTFFNHQIQQFLDPSSRAATQAAATAGMFNAGTPPGVAAAAAAAVFPRPGAGAASPGGGFLPTAAGPGSSLPTAASMTELAAQTRQPIRLTVDRDTVLEDSFTAMQFLKPERVRLAPIQITFRGEPAVDAGGVTREWFNILTRQMFDPNYALFENVSGKKVTLQPNRLSHLASANHLAYFRFVGRIIGRAIFDARVLDVHFTQSLYKHMLGRPISHQDMAAVDPSFHQSLVWILENSIDDVLDLTFSHDTDDLGQTVAVDLVPGGSAIPVTDANKHDYVRLVAELRLSKAIESQIGAFLQGLHEIIPRHFLSIFSEQELESLIAGMPDIDVDDWRNNTLYTNYSPASPQVQWFWRAVRSFSNEERAQLLQFVTGSSRIPLEGFSHLEGSNGRQRFSISKDFRSNNRLPAAHTCFNQLDLPEYDSYEQLRRNLLTAISECTTGFAFA
ncbi:hypothetical protein H696_04040 [Fonticula alba]|uniref:HECT-type E3 ubiquitin transferase n=1 Tax=Fonticula alba TaxID=691883 RepID=A0A058Z676_FONAL|nr:hypothetical protein H696_04040 [Fonticula alba]KCV69621.1 hypothetical protein H696_04040 [Fonticula alba]|eukprot:XP_009496186.1 hypothetical protein H696_04040 [Fonticula alba]